MPFPHPPGRSAQVHDATVLRALAHPLRGRLLGLLRVDGPSTASRLGERLGESSGVTSYHLRRLEAHGFVAEVAGRGTARERWWQAQHQRTSWEPDELLRQPGGAQAHELMQRHQIAVMGRQLREWVDRGAEFGPAWAAAAGLSDHVLRLTPEQARAMTAEVYALLDRWSTKAYEPAEGTEVVSVLTAVFPVRQP